MEFSIKKGRDFSGTLAEQIYAESEAAAIRLAEEAIKRKKPGYAIAFNKIQKR
ncbi:TPA: hypothetical protein ACXE9F_001799 [Pluralibacter gergoviae]